MKKNNSGQAGLWGIMTALALVSANVSAEPVGGLRPLSDVGKQMMQMQGKTIKDMELAVPSKDTVGIPVFPGSFYCSEFSGEGMLPAVILASDQPVSAIKEWYLGQEGLNWSDMWGMFYVGEEYVMMKSESVLLQDISEDPQLCACGMAFDMTGMKTQFTISYKPKTDS